MTTSRGTNTTGKRVKPEPKHAGHFIPRVPDDHPIFRQGFAVGGHYPGNWRKKKETAENADDAEGMDQRVPRRSKAKTGPSGPQGEEP